VTLKPGKNSLFQPGGTSLMIHANPDDYLTDPAGNAGPRIACGTITKP
jgi:Cu-Zn family superoxide dismutase